MTLKSLLSARYAAWELINFSMIVYKSRIRTLHTLHAGFAHVLRQTSKCPVSPKWRKSCSRARALPRILLNSCHRKGGMKKKRPQRRSDIFTLLELNMCDKCITSSIAVMSMTLLIHNATDAVLMLTTTDDDSFTLGIHMIHP
jgi:hypothetical protein